MAQGYVTATNWRAGSTDDKWHDDTWHDDNKWRDADDNKWRDADDNKWRDSKWNDGNNRHDDRKWHGADKWHDDGGKSRRTTKKAGGTVVQAARAVRAREFVIAEVADDTFQTATPEPFKVQCRRLIMLDVDDNSPEIREISSQSMVLSGQTKLCR